jgi:hypothetical protein
MIRAQSQTPKVWPFFGADSSPRFLNLASGEISYPGGEEEPISSKRLCLPKRQEKASANPPPEVIFHDGLPLISSFERVLWPGDVVHMFIPHANLSDEVNANIVQSEIEGGVSLGDLPPSTVLEIQTQHHRYTAVFLGESQALLSGHPEYCPEPVLVAIAGSTWGGSMLKLRYIGRGMHLEFCHPEYRTPIVTSRIQEVRERIHLGFEKTDAKGAQSSSQPAESTPTMLTRGTFTKPS